jgi:hypothetical protein
VGERERKARQGIEKGKGRKGGERELYLELISPGLGSVSEEHAEVLVDLDHICLTSLLLCKDAQDVTVGFGNSDEYDLSELREEVVVFLRVLDLERRIGDDNRVVLCCLLRDIYLLNLMLHCDSSHGCQDYEKTRDDKIREALSGEP